MSDFQFWVKMAKFPGLCPIGGNVENAIIGPHTLWDPGDYYGHLQVEGVYTFRVHILYFRSPQPPASERCIVIVWSYIDLHNLIQITPNGQMGGGNLISFFVYILHICFCCVSDYKNHDDDDFE